MVTDVVSNAIEWPKMRAIIKGLNDRLDFLKGPDYTFQIDYVEWEPHQLEDAVRTYLDINSPDLVLPIATTATRAAQTIFGSTSDSKPIVFTVISHPVEQGIVPTLVTPGGNTTGISTRLSQTAPECLRKFREKVGTTLEKVCWVYRLKFDPSEAAAKYLIAVANSLTPPLQCKRLVPIPKTREEVVKRLRGSGPDDLPTGDLNHAPRKGLLVVPDDLVVSHGDVIIDIAQGAKKIPVFFQVMEFVRNGDYRVSALGAYGIPGRTTGREAAEHVNKVLRGVPAGAIDVKELTDPSCYELWWNNTVATYFQVPTLSPGQGIQTFN
jgi:ABC-type uncharacterized transport system substrate-binding protein